MCLKCHCSKCKLSSNHGTIHKNGLYYHEISTYNHCSTIFSTSLENRSIIEMDVYIRLWRRSSIHDGWPLPRLITGILQPFEVQATQVGTHHPQGTAPYHASCANWGFGSTGTSTNNSSTLLRNTEFDLFFPHGVVGKWWKNAPCLYIYIYICMTLCQIVFSWFIW